MEKMKFINPVYNFSSARVGLPFAEYEQVKNIATELNMSVTQVLGQIVRQALKDGYEVENIIV